jgi:hypothetical protein
LHTDRKNLNEPGESTYWLAQSERGLVALLLLLLLGLHLMLLLHAGGLWRDEVNTVRVANLPDLGEAWKNLQYDSFPILWFLLLRVWTAVGGGGDASYRLLGLLIGLGIVGALMWNARRLSISAPLISLLLLAFNPAVIRYGDSMRAYGFGIALFLVTFGLVWSVASRPTRRNVIGATLAAVLSVQALYYNAVLLLALCAGGTAVAMRHRRWGRIGLLFGVGVVAAISLLPYASAISGAAGWNDLVRLPDYDLARFWRKLSETIGSSGYHLMIAVWAGLFCVGTAVGIVAQVRPQWLRATPEQQDLGLFCVTVSLVGMPAYFVFLQILSYPTQPWYYLALLALIALGLEGLFSLLANLRAGRALRMMVVLLAVMLTFRATAEQARQRHSNVDLIAAYIGKEAAKEDFILVNPWYFGIPFDYYYKGSTPWMTLPPVSDHKVHRYDLLKQQMLLSASTGAAQPVLERTSAALKHGHRVWIAGIMMFPRPGETPLVARYRQGGSPDADFFVAWSQQVGQFIRNHAARVDAVAVPAGGPLGNYENVPLFRVEGWRGG